MNQKVRIGLVGAGWMGSTLLRRLSERDDVRVRVLVDADLDRARRVLADTGITDADVAHPSEYQRALDDGAIDAVFLVSPNAYHGPQSIAAMRAGKHVFCEKPSSTTFDDHRRQIEVAQAHPHLKTFVDYLLHFDSFEERLRAMIAGGELGTITQIQINYRSPINISGGRTWKLQQSMMGDAISMGINHGVSELLLAMKSQARPVSVFATSMKAQVRPFEADPIWNILITFDNGATGFLFGNIDSHNGYDAYHNITGTRGALVFDPLLDRPQKVRMWREGSADGQWHYPLDAERCAGQNVEPWPADTTTPDTGNVAELHTTRCVGHFIECIHEDRQSPLSFVNSAIIAEIGWAAQASAKLKRPVALPLDADLIRRALGTDNV